MDRSQVVDVSATLPSGRKSFGSGYVVRAGLVLTSRHLICGDDGEPYSDVKIRFLADGMSITCQVAWAGQPDLDAALLRFDSSRIPNVPVRWGQLVASGTDVVCSAMGFPRSMEQDNGLREIERMSGVIRSGTGLLGDRIYIDVDSANPGSGSWEGMCGAAVWCGPLLTGVVGWDVRAFDRGRLAAEPVTRLFADPGFQALVGDNVLEAAELAVPQPPVSAPTPAYLLRAEAETAWFRSRTDELARLAAWCDGSGVRVRLLTGPGGQGKTRLARKLAAQLHAGRRWVTEIIPDGAELPDGIRKPLLVIVDYAETRPLQVRDLILAALTGSGDVPVRLLLLARSAGDWWDRLRKSSAELEMALAGAIADRLDALEDTVAGRQEAFTEALSCYAAALERMRWPHAEPTVISPPDLRDSVWGSALRLQMSALAALLVGSESLDVPLEEVILSHEERYWRRTATEHGLYLTDETLRCAVAAAALCGAADQAEAVALLSHVPGLRDQAEDLRLRAVHWLRDLYHQPAVAHWSASNPSGQPYWGSLQPDLLAEHLAASVAEVTPSFLPSLLESAATNQGQQALTVLARAAASRPHLTDLLTELLILHPDLASVAVTVATQSADPVAMLAALTSLVERSVLQTSELAAIFAAIPQQTVILNHLAIIVGERLVAAYDQLAEADADSHLHDLATALHSLSLQLARAGRLRESLPAIERAVSIRERLAEANPDAHLPDLARSLNSLSNRQTAAGQRNKGLVTIERAVAIRERLADSDPDAHIADLAMSLSNWSVYLAEAGQLDESLPRIERAVSIYEQLTEANPDAHLADLAMALHNLALRLNTAGRQGEGLPRIERAVSIYEQLTEANPDAHPANLALSLTNLSWYLAEAGRGEEGLAAIERAVAIYERLTEANPDAHFLYLGSALQHLSPRLAEAGRHEEGLAAIERSVTIFEQLAKANPDANLPSLAWALHDLSVFLADCGRQDESLPMAERAVSIYERLAEINRNAYLSALATALENLSLRLADAGLHEEGKTAIRRAASIRERLLERNSR